MAAQTEQTMGHAHPPEGSRVVTIAVDGSPDSDFAFDFYVENMRKPNDYIILVNCPEFHGIHSHWNGSVDVYDHDALCSLFKEEREKIEANLKTYKDKMDALELKGTVKAMGAKNPGEAICRCAQEDDAAIIVVGCRGHGTLRRTFVGSVSDYVVHHSHVPVAICRHRKPHHHHHHHDDHHDQHHDGHKN